MPHFYRLNIGSIPLMQIYPFSQLRNKGFSLFQSYFYKSGMLPLTSTDKQPAIASERFGKSSSKVSPWVGGAP